VADLPALRELYAWMRTEGILYARAGELELRLEVQPAPRVAPVEAPSEPDDDVERDLEDLLFSSGVEAAPFLRALRKGQAA
jgi:hypothetical protein